MPDISVNIAGLGLRNPVMLAAGILGLSGPLLKRVAEAGAGALVTKSVGLKPRPGYPNPTVVEVEGGLLNAMGLPNPGIKEFLEEIKIAKTGNTPIIISFYASDVQDFVKLAEVCEKAGVDALEVNISCPHVKGVGSQIGQDPDLVYEIVKAIKSAVEVPIFVKLTPNVTDIVEIAKAAAEAGADAITAINTLKAMAIDIETKTPFLANKIGGLSGPAIKPVAVRCVYEISKSVNIPIIGVGGITNWRDAVEFLLAGATAVQIGTAVLYRGLGVFKEVADGIRLYLQKHGYGSVGEIVGLSHGQ